MACSISFLSRESVTDALLAVSMAETAPYNQFSGQSLACPRHILLLS